MPDNKYDFEPHGFTLFCDDLREEITGKTTYVGVYGDVMFLGGELPQVLPKLAFVIHYFEPTDNPFESLVLEIATPGQTFDAPAVRFDIDRSHLTTIPNLETVPDALEQPKSHLTLKFNSGAPVPINQYGRFRVRVIRNGKIIPLGSLAVASSDERTEAQ